VINLFPINLVSLIVHKPQTSIVYVFSCLLELCPEHRRCHGMSRRMHVLYAIKLACSLNHLCLRVPLWYPRYRIFFVYIFFFIFFNLFRMERKKGGGWFWNRRSEVCHRVVAGQVSSFDWRSLVQNLFAFLCWFAPETGFSPSARHICLARSCFLSTIIPRFSWVRDARFRPTNYSTSPRPLRWTGAPRLLDNSTGLPTVPQDEGKID